MGGQAEGQTKFKIKYDNNIKWETSHLMGVGRWKVMWEVVVEDFERGHINMGF